MARARKPIDVSEADRKVLQGWLRKGTEAARRVERARIILMSADGYSIREVAAALDTRTGTVTKWRARYLAQGVAGLEDLARSGRPPKRTKEVIERIVEATVHEKPAGATHWSVRLMAKHVGVTPYQVQRTWYALDLRPHRVKSFKLSRDPHFVDKVVDIVGLYMQPPSGALVLCVDEKTQIQALDRTQPMLPLRPGQVERRTHDYKRHGTTSLYAAFNTANGKVIGKTTAQHRAVEFIAFMELIARRSPSDVDIHVILDNSSTHKTAEVNTWLASHPRFKLHFTPTGSSWLNAVEGWFGQLERRAVRRGVFTSVPNLRKAIVAYIEVHNVEYAKPFRWTKSASSILAAVERARDGGNQMSR